MADTLKGRKLYVCETPQPDELDQSGYEALTWVQVKHVGSIGETGSKDNIVSYDEMDSDVLPKGKGITNAGDPPVELARNATDPGQLALRAAGVTQQVYAFKVTDGEGDAGFTPATYYLRGLVGGPTKPNGRQENFNLDVYTIGCVQREIVVDPQAESAPTVILNPGISGTTNAPDVSSGTLTVLPGTYANSPTSRTYQWQRDAAGNGVWSNIVGAQAQSYDPQAGDLGNCIRVQETATNFTGSVTGSSMSTLITVA